MPKRVASNLIVEHLYVPNGVYCCGGLISGSTMLLPYAVADSFSAFGALFIDPLLTCMD